MLKKLSAFFVERIKFVDFYGWMYFYEGHLKKRWVDFWRDFRTFALLN